MKKGTRSAFFVVFIILIFSAAGGAEYIFLRDGNIIQGTIITDEEDYIIARIGNETKNLPRTTVMRILYTGLTMTKLFIQKRNGESFVAYLVDEDRDSYRFRRELYKPEEFSVPRKDILFISEKNPSALKGEPSTNKIKLTWLPPYGQVKFYNVYIKNKKEDKYKIAGTSRKTSLTISGLKSQTPYYFIVRAVDDANYETNPSNEIKAVTKSTLPERPDVKYKKDKNGNWLVSWKETKDKDGKVQGYCVYTEKDGKYSLFKETKKKSVTVPADTDFDSLHVRSVDNNGDESKPVDYRNDWRFMLTPLCSIPIDEMTVFAGNAYGIQLDISRRGVFRQDIELGITGGFLSVEGKKKIGEGRSNVTTLRMYPLALFFAYRIPALFNKFKHYDIVSFFPKISVGLMPMEFTYDLLDSSGVVEQRKSETVIEPFIKAGFFLEIGASRNFFFTFGSEFVYMIDTVQVLGMVNVMASAGFRF